MPKYMCSPLVRSFDPIGFEEEQSLFEVQMKHQNVLYKNIIQLGFNILQKAKVHLLTFVYDFLFLMDPKCFELLNTDTVNVF